MTLWCRVPACFDVSMWTWSSQRETTSHRTSYYFLTWLETANTKILIFHMAHWSNHAKGLKGTSPKKKNNESSPQDGPRIQLYPWSYNLYK